MRFPQVEQHSFIFRGNDFVAPMMQFCFMSNFSSENDECVEMIAISGGDFRNCVAAGNQDRQEQRDRGPSIDARAQMLAKSSPANLGGQKQTERRKNREESVNAFRRDQRQD